MRNTRVKTTGLLVGMLLLTSSTAWAQTSEKSATTLDKGPAPTAEKVAIPEGKASGEEEDCHGPLYYKMKNRSKERGEAERDRDDIKAVTERWKELLLEAEELRIVEKEKAQFRRYKRCLKGKGQPSLFCTALASHDVSLCRGVIPESDGDACSFFLRTDEALRKRKVSICDELGPTAYQSICRFVVNGEFQCETLTDPEFQRDCEAMKLACKTQTIPASSDPDVVTPAAWILAVSKDDESYCKHIPGVKRAQACKALANRDIKMCPLMEPLNDNDSCRDIILDVRTHKLGERTEITAVFGSTFQGTGTCDLKLHLRNNGVPVVRVVETLDIDRGQRFQRHFVLEKEEFVSIRGDCTWDPETSEYYLEEPSDSVDP